MFMKEHVNWSIFYFIISFLKISLFRKKCQLNMYLSCHTSILMKDSNLEEKDEITISYEMMFEPPFDFVLTGKLPGIYGGGFGCNFATDPAETG